MKLKLLFGLVTCATAVAWGDVSESATFVVCVDPDESLMWKTVTSSSMPVALTWPTGADRVQALVDGAVAAESATPADKTLAVPFALPTGEQTEKIVTLTLRYLSGETECAVKSVRLGLVNGTQDGDSPAMRERAKTAKWSKSRTARPVVPIPEGTTALVVKDVATEPELGVPGWQQLAIDGRVNPVSLTTDEATYDVNLVAPAGFSMVIR